MFAWRRLQSFRLVANRQRPAWCVRVETRSLALPQTCANCGQIAAEAHRLIGAGRGLLIPYCSRCAAHLARAVTTSLAATLASAMLVVTCLATLPRLVSELSLVGMLLGVSLAGSFPLLAANALRRRFEGPQTSSGRAVHWSSRNELVCFNAQWANQLAGNSGTTARSCRAAEHTVSPWSWLICALGLAATPSVHHFSFPQLVVLNFSEGPISVEVDGSTSHAVEPTSLESSRAGGKLRLNSGHHDLLVRDAKGAAIEEREAYLQAGRPHLLAVASKDYCFWLERDSYGKQAEARRHFTPLPRGDGFWVLPTSIDSWFAANPTPAQDERSTGGTMVALRHALCSDVPTELRAAFAER